MGRTTSNKLITIVVLLFVLATVSCNRTPDSKICSTDDDCRTPFTSCFNNFCEHKNVFPIEWQEILGVFIIFITISLGNAVGIGGGAIIVTVGTTLFYFTIRQAVAVATVVIFFAMLSGYIQNFHARHPLKNATLVDYGIVQCQMPLIALGVFIGALVSEAIPSTVIFILLFLTLLYATYHTFALAISTSQKEERLNIERKEIGVTKRVDAMLRKDERGEDVIPGMDTTNYNLAISNGDAKAPLIDDVPAHARESFVSVVTETDRITLDGEVVRPEVKFDDDDIDKRDLIHWIGATRAVYTPEEINPVLEKVFHGERSHFTLDKGILVLVPWGSIVLISLFRGSQNFKSVIGVTSCNFMDFFLIFLEVLILGFFSVINIVLLKRGHQEKKAYGYKFVRGDLMWNNETIFAFGILAIAGALIGGLVGLSTEVLFTPFYIKFGAPPSVAGVTSQFLGIFASLGAATVYAFNGYILWGHAIWLGFIGAVATLIGSYEVGRYFGKINKASVPVFIIAILIAASLIAEGVTGVVRTIRRNNDGEDIWAIGDFCY